MIYTVTFNPAIDCVMQLTGLSKGSVNRARSENIYYGGKGINVSAILSELGIKSTALGFIAGLTGDTFEKGVREMGIDTDFIRLPKGSTRINVKLHADEETEINGPGPDIDESSLDELFRRTDKLQDGDTLVIAGSIPASLPDDTYEKLLGRLSGRKIKIAADAEGRLLTNLLKYRPFVIKPNTGELSGIFGRKISTTAEIEDCAAKLHDMGAANVIVSMAGNGAFLLDENGGKHFCAAFPGTVVNSVGAGDSMLAGFLAGADKGYDYALRLGSACGGATAFSAGLADINKINELLGR